MIVLVMGVSGVGKTTVGEALARRLGWPFFDADDYHPPANVAKMAAGIALDDDDRWPWLASLNSIIKREQRAVLACSALRATYRCRLAAGIEHFEIVYLHGSFELVQARLARRSHRYMPAALLESQFAALEPPAHAIAIDVAVDPSVCVAAIVARLRLPAAR